MHQKRFSVLRSTSWFPGKSKTESPSQHNKINPLDFCYFPSSPLSPFLPQSFVVPKQGILSRWPQHPEGWGGEEGEERVRKAAVASQGARHNFISTSWAMKNMTSSSSSVTAVEEWSVKPALQIHLSFSCSHQRCTFPLAAFTPVGKHLERSSWDLPAQTTDAALAGMLLLG